MYEINRVGRWLAMASFFIGSLIFLLWVFSFEYFLVEAGMFYIVIAAIINSLFLLVLVGHIVMYETNRANKLKTVGLLLLNIPVAVLYFIVVISFF